jgi:hypothetical protein
MTDLLAAGAFTLLAAVVLVLTAPFPPGVEGSLSPAFYPRLLSGAIVLLAGLLAVAGLRRRKSRLGGRASEAPVAHTTGVDAQAIAPSAVPIAASDAAAAAGVAGLTALYLVAWHLWRFDLPTVLYVAMLSRLSGHHRWGPALLFGAVVTAFLFLAFGYMLRVPLYGI